MSKARVAAAALAAAIAIGAPLVAEFEGKRNKTYLDPIGIPTACYGSTGAHVQLGQYRTDAECKALLDHDLRRHFEEVAACVPQITTNPHIFAASGSLSFNIGANAFCRSTAARRFRSGDYRGGCEALGWFVKAGGRTLPGLVRRRKREVALCLEGVR